METVKRVPSYPHTLNLPSLALAAWLLSPLAASAAPPVQDTTPASEKPPVSKSEAIKRWKASRAQFKQALEKNEYEAAGKAIEESVAWARGMGDSDVRIVDTLYQAGRFVAFLRRYREAIPYYEEALRLREKQAGKDSYFAGIILRGLSEVEARTGNLEKATAHADKALSIIELAAGAFAEETADTLNDAAFVRYVDGRVKEGRDLAVRALGIYEKPLGKIVASDAGVAIYNRWADPAEVATMMNNLALFSLCEEDQGAAEKHLRRALKLVRQRVGKNNYTVMLAECNLGLLLLDADRPKDAGECFERALAAGKVAFSEKHPLCKDIEARLFLARGLTGSWGNPDAMGAVIEQLEPLLPPSHQLLAWPRAVRAMQCLKQGNTEDTLTALRELLATNNQGEDGASVYVARQLARLASQLEKEGKLPEATTWVEWAFSLAESNLPKNNPRWDPLLGIRGRILTQQGKTDVAVKHLRERVRLLDRADAGAGTRLAAALEELASTLQKTSAAAEADALLDRARRLRATPARKS